MEAVVDLDDAAEDLLRDDRERVEGGELDLVGRRTVRTVLDRDDLIALLDAEGGLRLSVKRSDHCIDSNGSMGWTKGSWDKNASKIANSPALIISKLSI